MKRYTRSFCNGSWSLTDLQVLDALLKDVCAALLETDVNVKLVASLRQKVKAKVKASLEGGADKGKDVNRKSVVQKVRTEVCTSYCGS